MIIQRVQHIRPVLIVNSSVMLFGRFCSRLVSAPPAPDEMGVAIVTLRRPGAANGYVTVATLSGKLTSNVPFQVIP